LKPQTIFSNLLFLLGLLASVGAEAQIGPSFAANQILTALRATELRADKLSSAPVLDNLPAGAVMRLLSVEGGWALVAIPVSANNGTAKAVGWVRASAVNWKSDSSIVSTLASGREAAGNTALTLGVRSLPPRVNRHALIIGISHYASPTTPPLPGTRIDKESATQMAKTMQVPLENIRYLQDEQATGKGIRQALQELTDKVVDGDRVFVHFSGHGTRYKDPDTGRCVEALMGYDGHVWDGMITNREMASMLKNITNKADKLFVMYDACYSGGVVEVASSVRTRGFSNANDEGVLRPKFSSSTDECARPVNVRAIRNLLVETVDKGGSPQDIIHVSASRDNEVSFDDELKGGLATQFMRDCMLRDAKDLDNSGAISMDEIKLCAQEKMDKRMDGSASFTPPHIVLNGNAAFVPAWFSQPNAVAVTAAPPVLLSTSVPAATPPAIAPMIVAAPAVVLPPPTASTSPTVPTSPSVSAPPVISKPPAASPPPTIVATSPAVAPVRPPKPAQLTGERALRQMFDQRDAKRNVQISLSNGRLKIGHDVLDFSVQSDRPGYVYVALAGSDNKSVYLLFPNELDQENRIEAGHQLLLPRANWRVKAAGPAGVDSLLVIVADAPRNIKQLAASKVGPFISSLNDAEGRTKLGALMTTSQMIASPSCAKPGARQKSPLCSDAFGASMVTLEEVK